MKNSNNFRARAFLCFVSMAFVFSSISAESQETLAVRAYRVLVKHCSQCHGKGAAQSDEMLLEHEVLLKDGLIRPGSAAKSKLYRVMLKGEMPREKNDNPGFFPRYDLSGPPVPQKEMAIVKRWIETGAPDSVGSARGTLVAHASTSASTHATTSASTHSIKLYHR